MSFRKYIISIDKNIINIYIFENNKIKKVHEELFELINESDLKITSQIYFEDIKYLKKLFYINDSDDKIDDNDENDDLDKMFADLGI